MSSTANLPYGFASPVLPKGTPPELLAEIEHNISSVLLRHGASAFAAPREAAAAHEAGHAIIGTHEGFKIRQISICSHTVPNIGLVWSGRCDETVATWRTGPDTSVESDLSRARFIVGGLAGEAILRLDKPGSSLDEHGLSRFVAINAAVKLTGGTVPDAEWNAYVERLWHEQVWSVAFNIIRKNHEPFSQLATLLHQHERVKGGKLHEVLAQVRRITPCQK
jgi:hypothetical protein